MGRAFPLCPGISDVNLFRYRERVINLDAEVSDGTLDFRMAEQELDRTQVASAPVDQRYLGAPKRVGAVDARIEADACDPLGDEPRVLPRCHAPADRTTAREQKLAGPLACDPEVVVDGLTRLVRQLKLDRAACLPLADCRAIDRIAVRRNVLDLKGHHIAATELAVDCQVEHGKVSGAALEHQSSSNRPDVLWPERRLG